MRFITLLLFIVPSLMWSQDCSEPSPVDYSGFGSQATEADYFADANSLDELNNSSDWSLGTGISDNNLAIWSNADIHTFLGVKLRYAVAPNDNVICTGNNYFVEPGYSLTAQNGSVGSGPEANWNILMYAGLDEGAFDSVDVVMHIDFDPCFSYVEEDMYSINIGNAFELNASTNSAGFSSFGINANMGAAEIANLNPNSTGFDANEEGFYTFAIEVINNCGTRELWNEITVHVGEFQATQILLTGMVQLPAPVSSWATNDYSAGPSDATEGDVITWIDHAGRLNDGRYSVTRIYTATDVCGNTSEAGQLLIANDSSAVGCTNANATNYDAAAVNDNGSCDYSPACLGDLNLDNIVGTSDLLILLSSFGLPCPE